MVPIIPKQRQTPVSVSKRFNTLINYLQGEKEKKVVVAHEGSRDSEPQNKVPNSSFFSELLDYATSPVDTRIKGEKCVAIRTHGVVSIETASMEMNAVSRKNRRCEDPVYHFILSWPEHERPSNESIFDAAEHAIRSIGFQEHQYVIAIHANTDNIHCHVAMNRINPTTFKSRNIEWAKRTLHYAARESEIKHGWSHDNGIYVVEVDGAGVKSIVLNAKFARDADQTSLSHPEIEREQDIPAWHDPEGLDSWLKSTVSKALRRDLESLQSWQALHVWLAQYDIGIKDSGGGGMRLSAVSPATGEVLDVAASKGLRQLKRSELEKRWGAFKPIFKNQVVSPLQGHLTPNQLEKGVEYVIGIDEAYGITPPIHLIGADSRTKGSAGPVSERGSRLHDVPGGSLASDGQLGSVLLQSTVQERMGDGQSGENPGLRHHAAGAGQGGDGQGLSTSRPSGRLPRDPAERSRRVAERAAQRADLRKRYSTYRSLVTSSYSDYFAKLKALKMQRSLAIKAANATASQAFAAIGKSTPTELRLVLIAEIKAESVRSKLAASAEFSRGAEELRAERTMPLSWRHWLLEQANRSDKAALAALRGIVYQEKRDAKSKGAETLEDADPFVPGYKEDQHQRLLKRLLDEERREAAIRSSSVHTQRAHEAEALVLLYAGLVWKVTGNGNVEYSTADGAHLFTDRGSRVTFDRVHVSDDEIKAALIHSREKFGNQVLLTGDDPVFSARMARIAAGLGLDVVNPELQQIVRERKGGRVHPSAPPEINEQGRGGASTDRPLQAVERQQDALERLRDQVRDIDPGASFVVVDRSDSDRTYVGPVVVRSSDEPLLCAQHLGRSVYALHRIGGSPDEQDQGTTIRYQVGEAIRSSNGVSPGRGR